MTGNINLKLSYIYRLILTEAAPEVKEAAKSSWVEDFLESRVPVLKDTVYFLTEDILTLLLNEGCR